MTRVIACSRCGAPAALSVVAREQACTSCGAILEMPVEVRAQLYATAQVIGQKLALASYLDAARGRVFQAERGTLLFAVGLVLLLCGGLHGLNLVAGLAKGLEHAWPGAIVPAMGGLVTAIGVALGALSIQQLLRRRLLRTFAARPPEPGAPHGSCHACGGPLPGANAGSVRCAYCRCDNLLGKNAVIERALDLHTQLVAHADDMLRAMNRLRVWTTLLGYGTLVLLPLLSGGVLVLLNWLFSLV